MLLLFWLPSAFAEIAITSTRIWPAQDYTRLTLESKQPIRYNLFTLKNPERLVIDLEDVEINAALNELAGKIGNDDPYIKSVRIGRFKPGVVRLVLDLKAQVKPQLFSLHARCRIRPSAGAGRVSAGRHRPADGARTARRDQARGK